MNQLKKLILSLLVFSLLTISFSRATRADGFIIVTPPNPAISSFPLEVKYHHVTVQISDQTATTSIDQEFFNPTDRRMEGTYLFPVPKGAVIKNFSMFIDNREMRAEMMDAAKARQIYEKIVRDQLDPALLEYSGQSLFKLRIFPIEPRSGKKIKITYHEILGQDNGAFEYIYPLNTEKFSARNLADLSIQVNIQSTALNLKNIYCPSHSVDITRQGQRRAVVKYSASDVKPDQDFKLYYNTDNNKIGMAFSTYRPERQDGFFILNLTPDYTVSENEIAGQDITFVFDNSGSMAGDKLEQAKKAMVFCLNNLNKKDRFEFIRFSTEAEALFGKLMPVNPKEIRTATEYIRNLNPIGGTNIDEALQLALKNSGSPERPHLIIFITDGKPTVGEINEERLLDKIKNQNIKQTRIFTFGIGYDLNTHLLDKITDLTRAYRTYILPQEDIELKISGFYTKVQSPVLTDLKLEARSTIKIKDVYPQSLPDLFKGSSLMVIGRYQGDGATRFTLSGKTTGGKPQHFEYSVEFPKVNRDNDFIAPLWAARRIGYLLDKVRLYGENPELTGEITDLARKYGIITPYTSYLIMEDEQTRVSRRELSIEDQTLGNVPGANDLATQNRSEYDKSAKSGSGSVQASQEIQALNSASNADEKNQGQSRMWYQDNQGQTLNLTQAARFVQGRAFYNSGEWWIDSELQNIKDPKRIRIKFAGDKYFELLRTMPKVAELFALGKNVRFVWGNDVYEIYQ